MRSGAGKDTSGALHHSYVNGVDAEGEDCWSNAFDAENAIPENAYLSQMIVVPESSRDLIRELQTHHGRGAVHRKSSVQRIGGQKH